MIKQAFLIKKGDTSCCSICGKELGPNGHKAHILVNEKEPIKEEDILYYTIEPVGHKIRIDIHNKDDCIYNIFFNTNGICDESKTEESLYWLDLIKYNFLFSNYSKEERFLSFTENECEIINKYFPSVYKINNIARFVEILSKRKPIYSKEICVTKLNKIPYGKINLNVGKKYDGKKVKLCKLMEYEVDNDIVFEVIYALGTVENAKIQNPQKYRFFISKNYIYNPKQYELNRIIGPDDTIQIYDRVRYDSFHKKYPDIKLKEFLESGGHDIVRFVLSNNNDPVFELIGKAGLGYLAEASNYLDLNLDATNIKSMFSMPVKALRALNSVEAVELLKENLKSVIDIYKKYPAIFSEPIKSSGIKFLKIFKGYHTYIKKDVVKYFRYINDLNDDSFQYYTDYLRMCYQYKLYPYGRFPKVIKEAHDVIMVYGQQKMESIKTVGFEMAVSSPLYQELAQTVDSYEFLIPRNADDLVNESYQMRNCVRSYVNSVAKGYSYIVFLRKKKSLASSFVTIEVSESFSLRQVKGKGNTYITKDIAQIVKNWCQEKGIDYRFCSDLTRVLEY